MKLLDDVELQGSLALLDPVVSDAANARQREILLQGKTAAGVLHTLLRILAHHEGAGADQKGEVKFYVNAGSDGTTPTLVATIASSGVFTFAQTIAGYLTAAGIAAAYQPLDADLTAIALITTDAFGRALLAITNAAGLRTAAGLGTVATLDVDTDPTMAANSNARVPSQAAVLALVLASVAGLWEQKGATDCSANPNYPAASKGDVYVVSVSGKIGGASGTSVDAGDLFVALADNAGGTEAGVGTSWAHVEHNLVGALVSGGSLGTPSGGSLGSCTGYLFSALASQAAGLAAAPFGPFTALASAATTDLGSIATVGISITGVATITSFGTGANLLRIGKFAGVLTLTHNATSLILPGGANITTAAGDRFIAVSDGSGNWTVISYELAGALPVNRGGTSATTVVGAADALAAKSTDIVAAGTTDLSTATGTQVDITGSTTITAFGTTPAGTVRRLRFTGAPLLTHNATSLILPGAASIQLAAGDTIEAVSLGSGNWFCHSYQSASSVPAVCWSQTLTSAYTMTNTAPSQKLLNGTANGAITLPVGLYYFEMLISLSGLNATNNDNGQFSLIGAGGATLADILYCTRGVDGLHDVVAAFNNGVLSTAAASPEPVASTTTGGELQLQIWGRFKVTAAGTVIPSWKCTSAPVALAARLGNYMKFWPTVAVVGPFS